MYMYMNIYNCMYHVHARSSMYIFVCTWYIHVHCICMYIVQTRLYSFTTTLHFPSCQISLETPASLISAQAPLLQSSLPSLPAISLLT